MIPADSTYVAPVGAMVTQGATSALIVAFYHDAFALAFPFVVPAVALIMADLVFGCAASKKKGEQVRFSCAVRRTIDKIVSYGCWVILAAALAVAFKFPALNQIILAIVMGVELISVVTNYFAIKGKKVTGLWDAFLKIIGRKFNTDLSDIKIEDDKNGTQAS